VKEPHVAPARSEKISVRNYRTVRNLASAAIVVAVFAFALPRLADLSQVWAAMGAMTWLEGTTLAGLAAWNIVTYWLVMIASLPGLNPWQAMKINQVSTAIANTLPGGGALGVGATTGMLRAYGFSPGAISLSILVTGIWNNFVKLGMPVVALGMLALEGAASPGLVTAALVGVTTLVLGMTALAGLLISPRLASWLGRAVQRSMDLLLGALGRRPWANLEQSAVAFRASSIGLLSNRWLPLTAATILSHLSLYGVLLLTLRHVGVPETEITAAEALAAFSFVRLLSALPVTPGGLGVVELALSASLVAFGGREAAVVAAVLVYRALTYLPPIPIGMGAYVRWRRGAEARRIRLEAPTPPVAGSGRSL
jgi:putative heme transporter